MWLIVALAATFSIAAAAWVGSIARESVLQQHFRRLALETDQLSSDLGQAISARVDAVRAVGPILRATNSVGRPSDLSNLFDELRMAYPQLDWIAVADANGILEKSSGAMREGSRVVTSPWFAAGLSGPWLGAIARGDSRPMPSANVTEFGDLAIPVRDESGRIVGVVAAHLSWRRATQHPQRLTDEAGPDALTQAYILGRDGIVLFGRDALNGKPWNGTPIAASRFAGSGNSPVTPQVAPQFERLPNGRQVLVSRSPLNAGSEMAALGWQVQLSEPSEHVYQRADALALRILWVSMALGVATAVCGAFGARHLTRRLQRLAVAVAAVGHDDNARLEVPHGVDEVAQLGSAFAQILGALQQERSELERRVAVRTREVERLAEESRYAAIVRERLMIARDLHDTLAHSMMAMLSEIRFLRRLQTRDPDAVPAELARAEKVAHDGLKEARTAITQMRTNAVRETGLGPALASAFERFINHTGISGDYSADVEAARFGDARAETVLRVAQEALRNVERHAMATRVAVKLQTTEDAHLELRVEDNGIGFDPQIPRPGHYGIVGLREQAEMIGADLQIDSKQNQGTSVVLRLKLSPIAFNQSA
jgi:signal transduction histidine kinase